MGHKVFMDFLVGNEILSEELTRKPVYKITDKGIAYVQGLLEAVDIVPLPIWLVPKT